MHRVGGGFLVAAFVAGCGLRIYEHGDDENTCDPCGRVFAARAETFSTQSGEYEAVLGGTLSFNVDSAEEVWIVLVSAQLGSSDFSSTSILPEARYLVNGVVRGIGALNVRTTVGRSPWQHFCVISDTTGQQEVRVELRDDSGAGESAVIDNLTVVAFMLPPDSDFHSAQTEAARNVVAWVWEESEELELVPSRPGSYLVMAVVNATEAPSTNGVGLRMEYPPGTYWPVSSGADDRSLYSNNNRGFRRSFFWARVLEDLSVPATIRLHASGGADTSEVSYSRIIAFRTDAFASFDGVEDLDEVTSESDELVTRSQLTVDAPPARRSFVVIQSLGLTGSTDTGRRAAFLRDGVTQLSYYLDGENESRRAPFGSLGVVTTESAVVYENAYATSAAGSPAAAKESVIFALGLPP